MSNIFSIRFFFNRLIVLIIIRLVFRLGSKPISPFWLSDVNLLELIFLRY